MPTWPSTLPAFPLAESFRETVPDTTLRTSMDYGPAKTRRRTTAGAAGIFAAYILDRTQVEHLDEFYQAALSGGALSFIFAHPRTGTEESCRFKKPPEYISLNGDYFRVLVELEVLP